jgi:hypothetical protein
MFRVEWRRLVQIELIFNYRISLYSMSNCQDRGTDWCGGGGDVVVAGPGIEDNRESRGVSELCPDAGIPRTQWTEIGAADRVRNGYIRG